MKKYVFFILAVFLMNSCQQSLKQAETDKLIEALDELGEDDFTETEIRLVRIKFLSEVGN